MNKIITLLIFHFFNMNLFSQEYNETIKFISSNPFSLNDIIENLDYQEKQEVYGKLIIPVDSNNLNKKYPLVIGVAGSLGWADHHYEYLKMYREMGIATFELNSFKSRGISSTVGTQNEVTIAAMIVDSYMALEKDRKSVV